MSSLRITDPENVIQSKYDIDELQQLKIPNKGKSVSFFSY